MQKTNWKRALVTVASVLTMSGHAAISLPCCGQETGMALTVPAGLQDTTAFQAAPIQYLPFAHFAIPFDIDRTGRLPQAVHLWVSADQGKSWMKYVTNSPDKRSFEFQAAAEGEYLFAVQTQDDRGVAALASALPMRIMVDTTKPQVQLSADINSAGRLVIDYRIDDRFLVEDSVRLSYAIDGQDSWEEIRVGRLKRDGDSWSGQIEQEMPRCHDIQLKLTASDQAQNSAETIARYNAPRTASANSGMQLASQRAQTKPSTQGQRESAPPASTSITPQLSGPRAAAARMNQLAGGQAAVPNSQRLESPDGAIAWEPARKANPAPTRTTVKQLGKTISNATDDQSAEGVNSLTPSARTSMPTNLSSSNPPAYVAEELPTPVAIESQLNLPAERSTRSTYSPDSTSLELSSGTGMTGSSISGLGTSSVGSSPALTSVLDKANATNLQAPSSSTLSNSALPEANVPNSIPQNAVPSAAVPNTTVPSAEVPSAATAPDVENETHSVYANDAYHSRSRSFSLDYSVESLRGLAIADIELWGTDDRGNTWQKWGSDPDRESPFDVQVGDDGLYGFRMVIIGQNGMVSNRPNDGDPADMWINVDTKFPSVKITRALYGEGPDAGMLVIDYSCEDENLHDRPISLAYSERPTGPWSTITTGLKNTGIYLWKADPSLPQHVYLRIQAVDRAGNVQEHRLDLPINLRGLTPRGRIQGFRPIDPK